MPDNVIIGERTIFNDGPEFEKELEEFRISIETQIQEFEKKYNCFFIIRTHNDLTAVVHIKPNREHLYAK